MTISDIITAVSLVIAIVAIINERNRKHLLLKYRQADWLLLAVGFLLVNYLVFYDYFRSLHIYLGALELGKKWPTPKNWAYVVSIACLLFIAYKISFAFFPLQKLERVYRFYQQQVENEDVLFLIDTLERYHRADIIMLIQTAPDYNPDDNQIEWYHRPTRWERFKGWFDSAIAHTIPRSWACKRRYASMVLHMIMPDPAFIALAANKRPHFFAGIIAHFRKAKRGTFPRELVKPFFVELLDQKNFWLKKELKVSQGNAYGQPEWFFAESPILSSVLAHLDVADASDVWIPFGEAAIQELEEERGKGYDSPMFQEFRADEQLWNFKTFYAVQFLFIIVIEAIKRGYTDSNFFLFYYDRIISQILKTYDRHPPQGASIEDTVYRKFIQIILDNLGHWLALANDNQRVGMASTVLSSFGMALKAIIESAHQPEGEKVDMLERLLAGYCQLNENDSTAAIRTRYETMLLTPAEDQRIRNDYFRLIEQAWNKFDKSRYSNQNEIPYPSLQQLIDHVVIRVGLKP